MENFSQILKEKCDLLLERVSEFQVLSDEVLPYGLKPHTRSICWLAEQVIIQNAKKYSTELKLEKIIEPKSELDVWDFAAKFKDVSELLYINIKITDVSKPRRRNDMSSIKRLINFFRLKSDAHLLYAIFPFKFNGTRINFSKNVITGYYSMMDDFVLNIRNQHLQAYYDVGQEYRTNNQFVNLLQEKASKRNLKV
jgi:hypothetical protein